MERLTADPAKRMQTYLMQNSDWVNVRTTISTSPDQIAIAPGSLTKEWTANGRRYFHYQVDHKSMNFYSFMSARFEVHREKWRDVDVEVYYQSPRPSKCRVDIQLYLLRKMHSLKDLSDSVPQAENKTPPPPIPIVMEREEHIFVSPLKEQKERERKRRNALMRFTLVLLLLITVGVLFFGPGILPANVRSAIPFLALPINTATPSFTPSATFIPTDLPTQTPTTTFTSTPKPPTATSTPTKVVLPTVTLAATNTSLTTTPIAPILSSTPIGGGTGQIAYASSQLAVTGLMICRDELACSCSR